MAENGSGKKSIVQLILVPSLITLVITVLRVVGELHHWGSPWFNSSAGGGGAIVGISWLPIIFGPYFALKLVSSGEKTSSYGKALLMTMLGLVVMVLAGVVLFKSAGSAVLAILGFVLTLAAAFVARTGWRSLGGTLIAYAFAARIPVLIVMYFAIRGGWGTHYDAVEARFAAAPLWSKFFYEAFLPQMMLWIGFTVVVGSLFGEIVAGVFARKPVVQPPS
jgi:hypothetical protein